MPMATDTAARNVAQQAAFNHCHVLTVCRDYRESGAEFWRLLYGTELESGFEGFQAATRKECLAVAVAAASLMDRAIVAYEHGYRVFRWVDVPFYRRTGSMRQVGRR